MQGRELSKCKQQDKHCCNCKHNATIDLFYRVKLTKDKTYLDIEDKSKSFLKQFAAFIASLTRIVTSGTNISIRRTDGTSINLPILNDYKGGTDHSCTGFRSHTILVSNNLNDRFLTFDDFNISHITATRVSGYPQLSHLFFADRLELNINDAWLYTGADTYIYATGLRVNIETWRNTTLNADLLIAKDVFDPPLQLLSNSRIDVSYKIVISL